MFLHFLRFRFACISLVLIFLNLQSDALILDCTYAVKDLWSAANIYACEAKVVVIGDEFNVTGASRNHLVGKNHSDVQGISIENQNVNFVPKYLWKIFPNFEVLSISSTNLNQIKLNDLVGLSNLKVLDLYNNKINKIEGDLFDDHPQIQHIRFEKNPLKHVGPDAFDNLKNLQSLDMYDAGCVSEYVVNNRAAVETLIDKMYANCPYTFEMFIVDKKFKKAIETEVQVKTEPMIRKMSEIEQILMGIKSGSNKFDTRLQNLEKNIDSQIQLL